MDAKEIKKLFGDAEFSWRAGVPAIDRDLGIERIQIAFELAYGDGREPSVLIDSIAVPIGATAEEVEAEVLYRARTYVIPKHFMKQAELPADERGITGRRKAIDLGKLLS